MGNLGDATVHTRSVLKPYRRVGRHQPVQLPDGARRRARRRGARRRQHGRLQARPDAPFSRRQAGRGRVATPGCPTASSTWSWAPARRVGAELQENPGHRRHRLHRLVRGRLRALSATFAKRYPRPLHRRDGRQEPGHRDRATPTSRRRPRASCARRSASAARSARPTRGSTSSGRSTTSSSELLVDKTEAITIGDPLDRDELAGPGHQREARRGPLRGGRRRGAARRAGRHRRRAAHRRRHGPRVLRRRRRSSTTCRPTTGCSATSCSCRSPRSRAVDSLDEALRARQRQRLRPDGRLLQRGRGEIAAVPRRDRGRRRVRQPAGRAPRPAPGRASSRSAAGRARARPARPGGLYYVQQFLREQSQTIVD